MDGSDLRRAATFHAVASAGGIAAAGRAMGKSAPAVHSDLRRFERDVGVPLMERAGRSLRLTPQGRVLHEAIGRALDELDRVSAHVRDAESALLPLRIGVVTGFGRYRLAPRLFARLPVERQLVLRTGAHDELLDALVRGEIDLALTYRAVTAVPIESEIVAEERLVMVGAGKGSDPMTLEAIEALPFVTYDEHEYVFGRWFADVFGRQPATLRRGDHCTELEEAIASVAAGRGVTIAPLDACLAAGLDAAASGRCVNLLYLCAVGSMLASPEAALIRACLV